MIKWIEVLAEMGLGGKVVVLGKTGSQSPTRVIAEIERRPVKRNAYRVAVTIAGEEGMARYSTNLRAAMAVVAKRKHIDAVKIKPGTIGEFYGEGPIRSRKEKRKKVKATA